MVSRFHLRRQLRSSTKQQHRSWLRLCGDMGRRNVSGKGMMRTRLPQHRSSWNKRRPTLFDEKVFMIPNIKLSSRLHRDRTNCRHNLHDSAETCSEDVTFLDYWLSSWTMYDDELDHVEDGKPPAQGLVIWRLMKEDDKRRALTSHVAPLEHEWWGYSSTGLRRSCWSMRTKDVVVSSKSDLVEVGHEFRFRFRRIMDC